MEFFLEEFNKICEDSGIARHKTVKGTPQQGNGLVERMNRTLSERVRCMMQTFGVSKVFWGDAAKTASYLVNRCPSTTLNFRTPREVWTGKPVEYDHLKIFGCTDAYAHLRQDKLDPRAKKCIFFGYPEGVKGYKLWCIEKGYEKCIISRDVVFNEEEMPMKKTEVQKDHKDNPIEMQYVGVHLDQDESDMSQLEDLTEDSSNEVENSYQLAGDRKRRDIRPPQRFAYADISVSKDIEDSEPESYKEATTCEDRSLCIKAMETEIKSLNKNNTWILMDKPHNQRLVGCRWIYKNKRGIPGVVQAMYKARLVARGFTQKEWVYYRNLLTTNINHTCYHNGSLV